MAKVDKKKLLNAIKGGGYLSERDEVTPTSFTSIPEIQPGQVKETPTDVSFVEGFSQSFMREWDPIIKAGFETVTDTSPKPRLDTNFNLKEFYENELEGTEVGQYYADFENVANEEEAFELRNTISQQLERRRIQREGGVLADISGGITAALLSPTTYLAAPLGVLNNATRAVNIAKTAAGSAFGVGLQEAAAQGIDYSRTFDESAFNVAGSAVLGGLLGGIAFRGGVGKQLTANELGQVEKNLKPRQLTREDLEAESVSSPTSKFEFRDVDGTINQIDRSSVLVRMAEWMKGFRLNPILRTLSSKSKKARELTTDLVNVNVRLDGDEFVSRRTSTEARTQLSEGDITQMQRQQEDLYAAFKLRGGNLTKTEFDREVTRALGVSERSSIKEVQEAARLQRRLYEDRARRGKKVELFEEDMLTYKEDGTSYVPSIFDQSRIINDPNGYMRALARALKRQTSDLADDEAMEIARNNFKIQTDDTATFAQKNKFSTSRGKGRTLNIDYRDMEEFMETDSIRILSKYLREVDKEIIMRERYGSTTMVDQLQEVAEEYNDLITKAKSKKEANRLAREKEEVIEDIAAMRDQVLGTYGRQTGGARIFTKFMLMLNTITHLGSSVISQLPDLAAFIGIKRLSRAPIFEDLLTQTKKIGELGLTKSELTKLSIGTDSYLANRAASIAGMDEVAAPNTWADRLIDKVTETFFNLNLMNPMNDWTRSVAANDIFSNWYEAGLRRIKGKLTKQEIKDLNSRGIGDAELDAIVRLTDKYKIQEGDVFIPNVEAWLKDPEGIEIMAKLRGQIDNYVLIPGAGDKFNWMSRGVGKLVGQFRGFPMASYSRRLIRILQDLHGQGGDNAAKAGLQMIGYMSLGGIAYYLKEAAKNRHREVTMGKFLLEGFDRGGGFPILTDINNILDQMNMGAATLSGVQKASRFRHSGIYGALGGPTVGKFGELAKFIGEVGRKGPMDLSQSDYNTLIRMVPYHNLLYYSWMVDMITQDRDRLIEF